MANQLDPAVVPILAKIIKEGIGNEFEIESIRGMDGCPIMDIRIWLQPQHQELSNEELRSRAFEKISQVLIFKYGWEVMQSCPGAVDKQGRLIYCDQDSLFVGGASGRAEVHWEFNRYERLINIGIWKDYTDI